MLSSTNLRNSFNNNSLCETWIHKLLKMIHVKLFKVLSTEMLLTQHDRITYALVHYPLRILLYYTHSTEWYKNRPVGNLSTKCALRNSIWYSNPFGTIFTCQWYNEWRTQPEAHSREPESSCTHVVPNGVLCVCHTTLSKIDNLWGCLRHSQPDMWCVCWRYPRNLCIAGPPFCVRPPRGQPGVARNVRACCVWMMCVGWMKCAWCRLRVQSRIHKVRIRSNLNMLHLNRERVRRVACVCVYMSRGNITHLSLSRAGPLGAQTWVPSLHKHLLRIHKCEDRHRHQRDASENMYLGSGESFLW